MIPQTLEEASDIAEFLEALKAGNTRQIMLPTKKTMPKTFLPTNRNYRRKESYAQRHGMMIDMRGNLHKISLL